MMKTPPSRAALLLSVIALPCSLGWAQGSPPPKTQPPKAKQSSPAPAKAQPKAAPSAPVVAEGADDDTILLTPFEVNAKKDLGYFAQNTLAGSRMNSNLYDLAASITVVTKQQLEDTASFDVNDVFRYEANTEGSSTYTPQVLNRNFVKDAVSGYSTGSGDPQTNSSSNRVRGIGTPTNSLNYYQTIPGIPFDSYNTQSIEISRGPNSLLFGLGSPAGVVNQTSAQAALNKNTNSISLSYGSYGSYRGSLAINRSLIRDKLAIYGAYLYDDREFRRKPSVDLTRREYAAITFKPFSKTQLRGSVEGYKNNNRRPNFISPRDYVTPWLQAGRPAYDPIARTVTILDTGKVYGPYVGSTGSPFYVAGNLVGDGALTSTTSPQYVPGITWNDTSRPVIRIDNGQLVDWFQKQPVSVIPSFGIPPAANPAALPTTATLNANPTLAAISERRWTVSNPLPGPASIPSYNFPGVTNQSIYDWERINTTQANFGAARAATYNVELEQQLLSNLFLSAGWFRQDYDGQENYTISQQQGATLLVDTNTKLINGNPNPYFGLPYIEDFQPDTALNSEVRDNYRVMLAYDLDLTSRPNWMKWLGHHRLLGMWSREEAERTFSRNRMVMTSADADATLRYLPNKNDNATTGPTGWNYTLNGTAGGSGIRRNYYLASPGDPQARVTHSTGTWGNAGWGGPTSGQIEVYNWTTGQFQKDTVGLETALVTSGSGSNQREVESINFGLQSFLFRDAIVATLGWRHDDYRARSTTLGAITDKAGNVIAPALTQPQIYENGYAIRSNFLNRWNRWEELDGNTTTKGVVVRPFKGWRFVETGAEDGSWWYDGLRNLSFTYNVSDNFNPPQAAQVDPFGKPLPKPTGKGKDYGVRLALFQNKLVLGVNWFEATNENERTDAASLLLGRLVSNLDTNIFRDWASTVVRLRSGENPNAANFGTVALTPTQEQQVADLWKLPYNYYTNLGTIGATQTTRADGYEVQLTYNPTRNWTMKLTGGRQVAISDNIAPQYDQWLAVRLPAMKAAVAPDIADYLGGNPATTQTRVSTFWNGYGWNSNVRLTNTGGQTSPEGYYINVVDSQVGLAKALEGLVAPNQRKYRASYVTNYAFTRGMLNGFGVGGAYRWESKSALGYYGRAGDPTRPTELSVGDPNRPIFDKANHRADMWVSYTRKVFNDKYRVKVQLNVTNVFEDGHLQPIAVNFDGSVYGYRIIDPREYRLTTTLEF